MPSLEHVSQTETGIRNVREATFRGHTIQVITGYDASYNEWPFHVYIHRIGGGVERLTSLPTQHRALNIASAFEQGMALALQHLDPSPISFQRDVR